MNFSLDIMPELHLKYLKKLGMIRKLLSKTATNINGVYRTQKSYVIFYLKTKLI